MQARSIQHQITNILLCVDFRKWGKSMHYRDRIEIDSRNTGGSSEIVFGHVTQRLFLSVIALLSVSCSSFIAVPAHEYETFDAKPQELRAIEAPKILFVMTDDIAPLCESLIGKLQLNKQYLGCAHWNVHKQFCTVYVPADFQDVILGHEVRHCFEGAFH